MKNVKCAICGGLNDPQDLLECPECHRLVCLDCVSLRFGSCEECAVEDDEKPTTPHVIKAERLAALRYKPEIIEAALKHCTTKEYCKGCPLSKPQTGFCGHTLNLECLKYINILKDLNSTFAQRIEELEGGAV